MEELRAVVQELGELRPELVDLLLDQQERLILLFLQQEGLNAAQKEPAGGRKTGQKKKDGQEKNERVHDRAMRS